MSKPDNQYLVVPGVNDILLSAPHTYPQLRPGYSLNNPKSAEFGLYRLVKNLCHHNQCWGIIATSFQSKDPNWYFDSLYRLSLIDLVKKHGIKTVLDLHGKKDDSPLLIFYKNSKVVPNQVTMIESILAKHKILKSEFICKSFIKDSQVTISESMEKLETTAIEVEISPKMRTNSHQQKLTNILNGIISELLSLNKQS